MKLGFVFSLPRAGSTYVQRALSASPGIATISEPWLLPPLMAIRNGDQPYSQWGYDHARRGIEGMLENIPNPDVVWRKAIRSAAETVYSELADDDQLFIDKTPRNAEYAQEILRTFPDAKILFLWRNPLAVVKSINETWGNGHWKTYFYEYDLCKALAELVDVFEKFRDEERVVAVRYEELVGEPDEYWPAIFEHFGVSFDSSYIKRPPKLIGRMGDVTGQQKFSGTSNKSIDDWPRAFGSSIRRRWARKYLSHLGENRLNIMGYDRDDLLTSLKSAPTIFDISDYIYLPLAPLYHRVNPFILRQSLFDKRQRSFANR